ncbi:hypothetical protein Cmtc_17570 [Cupriavidus sp. TKC]|uniref:hypothetical protein n=1 Tax=Cupriavidus sp. TKC TaxID=2880159 RepID=UPI0025A9205C|nr:hypothetical protein [Cupriavidus sp. TKC]GMG90537.1 hypothetical protein Cmtc_17570 [Cupriavidus sp. TKC]
MKKTNFRPCRLASIAIIITATNATVITAAASQPSQTVQQGKVAPSSVTAQLQGTPAVVIGSTSVQPVRQPASASVTNGLLRPLSADPHGNTTYVVRTGDNLVGISTNDLVVIYPDTSAIVAAAGGATTSAKPYPDLGMVVLHVGNFDQIEPLHRAIAERFPTAKFDLPVTYFPLKPK